MISIPFSLFVLGQIFLKMIHVLDADRLQLKMRFLLSMTEISISSVGHKIGE